MGVRLKIVVADDDRDTREYLHLLLSARLGHDVRAAEDGRRLVEVSREFGPDLIVTDFAMPGLDGLAAVAEVNRERRVPAVVLSGRHDAESLAAATDVVAAFLQKPVKEADLAAAVAAVGAACLTK
jgi:CheY-like chemotaxis protein